MKTVVFTALIGPGAPLNLDLPLIGLNARAVCLTDREGFVASGWEIIPVPPTKNFRHTARMVKHAPDELFPDAEYTVWVDASFTFLKPIETIVADALSTGAQIAAFQHPDRKRIRDEADAVIACRQAPREAVERQILAYREQGFDTSTHPQPTLTTTGLLCRLRTPEMAQFNRALRTEICAHTVRDQLCIDYLRWALGVPIGYLQGHYRDNPYVKYHRNRKMLTIA
jgi:hypothetical protein